jgi:REP element-mobilizing transposase RayT
MNRGSCHQPVFVSRRNGERFLEIVADWSERTQIEVHAYCLMSNHFHLLVRSGSGRLAEFMQHVAATYTRQFNRQRDGDGALFRGRYHARRVDTDEYLSVAGRYIHRNPTSIRPRVALDRYWWSSYRYYVGRASAPPWLHTDVLLGRAGGADAYRGIVEGAGSSLTASDLSTLIPFAIDELSDGLDAKVVRLQRTVAAALLDELPRPTALAMLERLNFSSVNARHSAQSRARRRVREEPAVRSMVERLRDVAA